MAKAKVTVHWAISGFTFGEIVVEDLESSKEALALEKRLSEELEKRYGKVQKESGPKDAPKADSDKIEIDGTVRKVKELGMANVKGKTIEKCEFLIDASDGLVYKAVGWGKLARKVANNLREGDSIQIIGQYRKLNTDYDETAHGLQKIFIKFPNLKEREDEDDEIPF